MALKQETVWERIAALVDIVPSSTRARIAHTFRTASAYAFFGGRLAGNLVWVVTTSALLVGLPYALALEDESRIVAQEKEMYQQQQGAQVSGGAHGSPAWLADVPSRCLVAARLSSRARPRQRPAQQAASARPASEHRARMRLQLYHTLCTPVKPPLRPRCSAVTRRVI